MLGRNMELDRQIQEKRTEIREALAAYQKAREAATQMRNLLSELRIAAGAEGTGSDLESLRSDCTELPAI